MGIKNRVGKWTTSQRLQFAAFMVAAPRYMALGAMALGIQPTTIHPLFIYLEVASWLGFAVLEGYAIPYIAKGIRKFTARNFEWWQLQVYRAMLLLAIPGLGAPLYLAISQKQTMLESLGVAGFVVWAFALTGVGALVIDAVGTCESVNEPEQREELQSITIRKGSESSLGAFSVDELATMLSRKQPTLTPDNFVIVLRDSLGVEITTEEASRYLLAAQPVEAPQPAPSGRKNGKTPLT